MGRKEQLEEQGTSVFNRLRYAANKANQAFLADPYGNMFRFGLLAALVLEILGLGPSWRVYLFLAFLGLPMAYGAFKKGSHPLLKGKK